MNCKTQRNPMIALTPANRNRSFNCDESCVKALVPIQYII